VNVETLSKNDGTEKVVCQFTYREHQNVAMSVMDTLSRRYISNSLYEVAVRIYQYGSTIHDIDRDDMVVYFDLIDYWNDQPNNPAMLDKPTVKNDGQCLTFSEKNKRVRADMWLEAWTVYKKPLCGIDDYFQTFYPFRTLIVENDELSDFRIDCLQNCSNRVAIWQARGVSYDGAVRACLDDVYCDGMELEEILEVLGDFTPAPVPESEKLILTADNVKTDNRQYEHRTNEWLEAKIQDAGYEDDEDLADQRKLRKYAEKLGLQRKY